ncbi:thiopurine S-methyltransferase [Gallaecimonas xiamenensis]|uniref:Thiopurine S-methyltransferase n=1 Tax=Gallaecimonas xiamenensis 3-C-1 TaxID=745411 RepID=K2J9J0_9GAMM|nr:thiopurine S-methyltransferase [Gallaecimonas xiamenensis]EKE71497.1 thiopurine S-methyltransferase [Gallaecimonas xiamenensis 3-C-1]
MQADFWHQKWASGEIGFHQQQGNPQLQAQLGRLALSPGARLFLPLCGKTRDIAWLLAQGFDVAGAELSPLAIRQLFAELGVEPQIEDKGPLHCYSAPGIAIWVGDIFALNAGQLGPVDAVFDRAALVALPGDMRPLYAQHLQDLTRQAPQLLVTFDYDQAAQAGPPFSVGFDEVQSLYGDAYQVELLAREEVVGGLKGLVPAEVLSFLLQPLA